MDFNAMYQNLMLTNRRPTQLEVYKKTLPTKEIRIQYLKALVNKFGIKALVHAGFPGGKKELRKWIEK